MGSITKTKLNALPAAEAAELEEILREFAQQPAQFTSRFFSDEGDTLAWFLLLGLVGLGGVIAGTIAGIPMRMAGAVGFGFPQGVLSLVRNLPALGFTAAVAATLWSLAVFLRTHRRCGFAVTSYGVARVFGSRLMLLRFADIARAEKRRVNVRRPFFALHLTTHGGRRWTIYATPLMDTILARVQPSTSSP